MPQLKSPLSLGDLADVEAYVGAIVGSFDRLSEEEAEELVELPTQVVNG